MRQNSNRRPDEKQDQAMYVIQLYYRLNLNFLTAEILTVRKTVTIQTPHNLRASEMPITMLMAYGHPTAVACSSSPSTPVVSCPARPHLAPSSHCSHVQSVALDEVLSVGGYGVVPST